MSDVEEAEGRAMVMHRAAGRCEVGMSPGCATSLPEWHHRQSRRMGDHRPSNGLAACRACHSWIHANPGESIRLGWIVPTWEDPAGVLALVLLRGQYPPEWARLTVGGTYTT